VSWYKLSTQKDFTLLGTFSLQTAAQNFFDASEFDAEGKLLCFESQSRR